MTVTEIAKALNGILDGNNEVDITNLSSLSDAGEGDIAFLSNPRYNTAVSQTKASAIIVNENWEGSCPCAVIRVKNADKAFADTASLVGKQPIKCEPGIHSSAIIAEDVELGKNVSIGPYCVLESGVKLGDRTVLYAGCYLGYKTTLGNDCKLYPYVSTREYIKIGNRVIIHNGTVVGCDGFGYLREGDGWKKIPQIGTVEIGDDVEIGANVTIDRARFGKTVICNGVKLDNLVHIAHNVKVGKNSAIAAQVGTAGSAILGENIQIGGQAGIDGHLTVGNNVIIAGKAGVTKDIPPNSFISGFPAIPHMKARRIHGYTMRLPLLKKKVDELEKKLDDLTRILHEKS